MWNVEEEGLLLERSNIVYETSIGQDTGSTLGPETGYPYWILLGFYQSLTRGIRKETQINTLRTGDADLRF